MHPVKLEQLKARGLERPGRIGPVMYIWEKNVNIGRSYIIDSGSPPPGDCISSMKPGPEEFDDIDELGWDGWKAKENAEIKGYYRKHDPGIGKRTEQQEMKRLREFLALKQQVMREQGIISATEDEKEDDGVASSTRAKGTKADNGPWLPPED